MRIAKSGTRPSGTRPRPVAALAAGGPQVLPARPGDAGATTPRLKLADTVYDQLFRLISRGDFPRGCKLPPELELCRRFGVSRPVLRDALSRLRAAGYVRSQRGSGTVVERGEAMPPVRFPPIVTVADLLHSYEFRIAVETATCAAAAARRGKAGLAGIEAALQAAEAAMQEQAFHLMPDLNFAFHRAVARATGNGFYVAALEMLPNFVGADRLGVFVFGSDDPGEHAQRIQAEHVSIFRAIEARDPERARAEMQRHIAAARDHVLGHHALRLDIAA